MKRGFTIIEVMVSMLLLSIAIVSIFGAQFSASSSAEYSKHVTQAVQLARCKMSELELYFQTEGGFEEGDIMDSGDCCEVIENDDMADQYTCRWEIKTIVLPDISQMMSAGGADGGMLGDLSDMTGGMGMGGEDNMSGGEMADMGMGLVGQFMPMITGLLEQAIRRVTVTVEWQQGSRSKEIQVSQYVVHPTQGPLQLMQQADTLNKMAEDADVNYGETNSGRGGRGFKAATRQMDGSK